MKKLILASVATIFLASVLVACGGSEEKKEVVVKRPQVKLSQVVESDVEQIAEFTGSIEPFVQNNISSSLGLRIEKIFVDVGDNVRKGQLLVQMDQNQYMQAAVQLANLETDFERMENLYKEGGISKQQLDQQETQLEVSRHAVQNLKENAELRSPVNGVVTARFFDPGDMFMPSGGGILTVMEINKLKVMISVAERYYPQINEGMTVDVELEIYPGEVFEGKVSLVYPALDPQTRTFQVEITVANPTKKLRPGMLCKVIIGFGEARHVLVPDIAVLKQQGSSERYLFVVNPADSMVSRRTVEIGQIVGSKYEIISGVQDNEYVVIAGMQKLLDGDKVDILSK